MKYCTIRKTMEIGGYLAVAAIIVFMFSMMIWAIMLMGGPLMAVGFAATVITVLGCLWIYVWVCGKCEQEIT